MVLIRAKQVREKVKRLDSIIKEYKKQTPKKNRNYTKYESEFKRRLKGAIKNLDKLINESIRNFNYFSKNENKHSLPLAKRMRLILIKELNEKGNRKIANLLDLFSMLNGTDISYKTVERLYSDNKIILGLHNLFILTLNKRGIKNIDTCGDATGYALTISKHYSSYVQKLKDKSKSQENNRKKCFVYKFALMDLKTRMYVCFGTSLISEAKAFHKAMQMLEELEIEIESIRLDRYYSFPCYVSLFKQSRVYIIPRKGSKLGHGDEWLNMMKSFVYDTMRYLKEYFQRENSENGWSCDKKMFGWKVAQKREDRIDTALFCRVIWHDLFYLY